MAILVALVLFFATPAIAAPLTIHGNVDPYVPYRDAVRLHQALDNARLSNRLVTVRGGGHGDFTRSQRRKICDALSAFLKNRGLMHGTSL